MGNHASASRCEVFYFDQTSTACKRLSADGLGKRYCEKCGSKLICNGCSDCGKCSGASNDLKTNVTNSDEFEQLEFVTGEDVTAGDSMVIRF